MSDVTKIIRTDRIKTIKLGEIRVSPVSQRELRPARVKYILRSLDFDKIGTLEVSERDGFYYIIDGQHRFQALCEFLGDGWASVQIQVWVWTGLTEEQEARKFLERNDVLAVDAYAKFKVGVTAGDAVPCDINRIILSLGLKVSKLKIANSIGSVTTLTRIYSKAGPRGLSKTLALVRDGLGDMAFDPYIIEGLSMFWNRYEGRLEENRILRILSVQSRGVKGILSAANLKKEVLGQPLSQCVASVVTDSYNKGLRGPSSLGSWWRDGDVA
jgi:hypothetical protein